MNTNLNTVVELYPQTTIEAKLFRMKELKNSIKVLEAEFDMIKKEVIAEHFINHEEYCTAKGLKLATYKAIESLRFNSTKLKKDHYDVWELYSEKQLAYRFDLK